MSKNYGSIFWHLLLLSEKSAHSIYKYSKPVIPKVLSLFLSHIQCPLRSEDDLSVTLSSDLEEPNLKCPKHFFQIDALEYFSNIL